MDLISKYLAILMTAVFVSPPIFANRVDCAKFYEGTFDKSLAVQSLPTKNSEFEIAYDGKSTLEVILKDKSRIKALTVIGGGPFPGSFGIVSNTEFNVGTSNSIMKFKILDRTVKMVAGYEIHSQPNFSEWSFSANGRYAIGVYKQSAKGYKQIYVFDFQSTKLNKGSQSTILDDPNDPLVSVSILDSGAVVALSKTSQNLPFVD